MLVGQSARPIGRCVGWSVSRDRLSNMLVNHSAGIDSQVCWSVSQPREIGWYVVRSDNPVILGGMLVSQSTLTDRLVCWLVSQPG